MLLQRVLSTAARVYPRCLVNLKSTPTIKNAVVSNCIPKQFSTALLNIQKPTSLLTNPKILSLSNPSQTTRTVIKFSLNKGRRRTERSVLRRFYRLNWGGWIRTKCGRHKRLWRKSMKRKRRLRQHVFCNATQCSLLDKMVTMYWKRPKYYVDDPYEPYHSREEFRYTAVKPRPYFPKEENQS